MKKPNPVDYVFKDIAKFDTQNLAIGDLLKQTQKVDLDNLPSIKDIEIRGILERLKNDSFYSGNNSNNIPAPPGIPLSPQPRPPGPPPPPPNNGYDNNYFILPSPPPPPYPPTPLYRDNNFDVDFPEKKFNTY